MRLIRLLPSSTAAQSSAILIGSITLAHLLFGLTWLLISPEAHPPPGERAEAAQIATVIRMIAALPPEQRPAAVAAASSPSLHITRETAPTITPEPADGPQPPIVTLVRAQAGGDPAAITAARPGEPGPTAIVLRDGDGWLIFRPAPRTGFRGPFGILSFPVWALLLIGIPLVALSLWAARRVSMPLARLAQASETLALEGEKLPIPANATVEIRRLAGAFNALVERLQKFAADRTTMLAAISHDLRTPLTRLRLRTESLDDAGLREKMLRDIRSMGVMISSTLAYVEQQQVAGPLEQIDIAALLQTLCDEFADSGYDVTYEGPLHCRATGRPHALERALNNLIENAIKFGSTATLALDSDGPELVIDVCDAGPGIADAEKDEVLKPFYRSDAARGAEQGGIGLGLAIANTIVQSHGGSLELLDRTPHGLCVRVRMPRRLSLAA